MARRWLDARQPPGREVVGVYSQVDTEVLDLMIVYLRLRDGTAVYISERVEGRLARRMKPVGDRAQFEPIGPELRERLVAVSGPLRFGSESDQC
jgi:hypothetical protein